MQIEKINFGSHKGQGIDLYILRNNQGMVVKVMTYGATITDIVLPGNKSIACGFNTFDAYFSEEYKSNAPYFGCTVGRYCSQIKEAKFVLGGREFKLAKNCGDNNLHGGITGFDKKVWAAKTLEYADAVGLEMGLLSKDMEEGFPGDVKITVTFILNNLNELKIDYRGVPTSATPLSMTNHTYFNLSGFKEDILGHKVTMYSHKRQETDGTGAATGLVIDVEGSPDDLRDGKLIGDVQKAIGGGFEHFYLTEIGFTLKKVAEIEHPGSGVKLEVSTTEPCMLLYSGKYTSNNLKRENGDLYGQYRGLCCETHRYQNGPNIASSLKTFTKEGAEFSSTTIFKLNW